MSPLEPSPAPSRPEGQTPLPARWQAILDGMVSPSSRRQFLKLMGASLALGGLTGCRWPREEILPFTRRPEGRLPGLPSRYATAMEVGGIARPLVVTSWEGRPTKVEGNELHPESLGATDLQAQASVLDLYDPHRLQRVSYQGSQRESMPATWEGFREHFVLPLHEGRRLAILTQASASESRRSLLQQLRTHPRLRCDVYEYEPISRDSEVEGLRLALGAPHRCALDLGPARVIVSLDADLLGTHPGAVHLSRQLADGRRGYDLETGAEVPDLEMSRLYVLESGFSLTGSVADWRRGLPAREVCLAAGQLVQQLAKVGDGLEMPASLLPLLQQLSPVRVPGLEQLVQDLLGHRGESLIVAGGHLPPEMHALAALLNQALGNVGRTVHYQKERDRPTHLQQITSLASALEAGEVEALLILGGNPAYDAPADLDLHTRLSLASRTAHLTLHACETSGRCDWVLPRSHYLEAWGDAASLDGTRSVVQPLIAPLHDTRSELEVLSLLADDEPRSGYTIVREALRGLLPDEPAWRRVLHDGLVPGSAPPLLTLPVQAQDWGATLAGLQAYLERPARGKAGYEVVLRPDLKVGDGRHAGNAWLQEIPDPLTKLAWDNAAILGAGTARQLEVETGDLLELRRDGRRLDLPAFVLPGHPDGTITVPLGYGRQGHPVAEGAGADGYLLRTRAASHWQQGVEVRRTGRRYPLATTQSVIPPGRLNVPDRVGERGVEKRVGELVRELTLEEFRAHPHAAQRHHDEEPPQSLWLEPNSAVRVGRPDLQVPGLREPEHRWALCIDLGACTGCGACVAACTAENNIPVVGKEEVAYGREMQWLRIDRYFIGEPGDVRALHQPVPCMQCETAPCEEVCPVAATVHSAEGLNDMIYNRCVGTRYCQNNCPYKVRRYNYWNNHLDMTPLEMLRHQPDVTVRGRGVMEKCSYCVQRIARVHIQAQNRFLRERSARDPAARRQREEAYRAEIRAIQPACAQTCPARALHFGDLRDAASPVTRLFQGARCYSLLGELNTKPRTRYLARLHNPPRGS